MATFLYVALNEQGKEVTGNVIADNENSAAVQIREMGYFPKKISLSKERRGAPAAATKRGGGGGGAMAMQIKIPGITNRIRGKALSAITRQLATLQGAGLPLVRSLHILRDQSPPSAQRDILGDIAEKIEGGSGFSEALAQHPSSFSKLYVNMVKAGEVGGILDTVLDRLATFMEKEASLRRKIKGAMTYPIIVSVVAVGILAFIVVFVIPTFEKMFADFGKKAGEEGAATELPVPTQILLNSVKIIKGRDFLKVPNVVWVAIGIVLLLIIFKLVARTTKGKYALHNLKLKLLIFGPLFRKTAIARFARTLGTLLNSGVPILQALNITKDTSGNEVLARTLGSVHDSIREGEAIADRLAEFKFFPPIVVNMVDVGEETGALEDMLIRIAVAYEDEVDTTVEALSSTLEPLLIVVMGVMVGFIVIALFLPIIKMATGLM